jgi:hypothetical protein
VKRRLLPWLALAAYACLLLASAPRWPDDWDGVGFVESVTDFDLAAFRPHPPGYPVYVALLRVGAFFARDAWRACVVVAVASGAMSVAFTWAALRRARGEKEAWIAALFVAVAPLSWRSCSGVGSEAPALACAMACAWGLTEPEKKWKGALAVGLGAGLGLGVRLSWAPVYLALLLVASRGVRARAAAIAALASLAWAVPLVLVVGASRLVTRYATHFSGHAERWGGTAITEPGLVRFRWFTRDVFFDGLGVGCDALGLAIGALLAIVLVFVLREWRAAGWPHGKPALAVSVPYALWVFFGQNLRDQPRHVLPLVVLICLGLACGMRTARLPALVLSLATLVAVRAWGDAWARRTVPPPGQQLVELARAQPSPDRLAIFGVSSVRFFETTELAKQAFIANDLGDAEISLARVDRLPLRVWVTSEVEGLADSASPLSHVATLCRPKRIERRAHCIDVFEWKLKYLPRM